MLACTVVHTARPVLAALAKQTGRRHGGGVGGPLLFARHQHHIADDFSDEPAYVYQFNAAK